MVRPCYDPVGETVIITRIQIAAPLRRGKPLVALLLLLAAGTCPAQPTQPTALDRYVAEPDPSYSFRVVSSVPRTGYTAHVLEMTSQTWRSSSEVDKPIWRHWLRIAIPAAPRSPTALLLISGGSNSDPQPSGDSLEAAVAVAATGAVIAELLMVPNQPLKFPDESRTRSEDALIAYSWDKYLRTGDGNWPAQLPMTKAVVRAMDTVTAFCRTAEAGSHTIDKFVVAGGSKRGWATWTTAAVDRRVVAIIPLVIDVLNVEQSFRHHWQTYGLWAPAVTDYAETGVLAWLGTGPSRALQAIIDPYSYRARYTMPKYIVNASGDEFFVPDSSRFYFDDLPGPKYLLYVANSGHGLDNIEVLVSSLAFFQSVTTGTPLPRLSWDFLPDGGIRLRTEDPPSQVTLWQASNRNARDFRVETIGRTWTGSALPASSPGVYEARIAAPAQGWSAFFIEATYPSSGLALKLSTPVRVTPDMLPFAPPLGTVSAAHYIPLTAPESIASAFGAGLSVSTATATGASLPENLAGTSVRLTDNAGIQRSAPLFYVSPLQVNFQVPSGTATGLARVEVIRDGQLVTKGQTLIEATAPALFSANADGRGTAAGTAVTVAGDGSQVITALFDASAPPGSRTPVPVDLSAGPVYLSLFGTGMRRAQGPVTATVGGQPVVVAGPLPQSQFVGLDQVNLGPLPATLAGKGEVNILLTVAGKTANVVTVVLR